MCCDKTLFVFTDTETRWGGKRWRWIKPPEMPSYPQSTCKSNMHPLRHVHALWRYVLTTRWHTLVVKHSAAAHPAYIRYYLCLWNPQYNPFRYRSLNILMCWITMRGSSRQLNIFCHFPLSLLTPLIPLQLMKKCNSRALLGSLALLFEYFGKLSVTAASIEVKLSKVAQSYLKSTVTAEPSDTVSRRQVGFITAEDSGNDLVSEKTQTAGRENGVS